MSRSNKSRKVNRPRANPQLASCPIETPDFSKVEPVPRIFGYIRVSREDQNLERQRQAIEQFGVDRVFEDKLSGRTDRRPEYARMIKHTQPGDTVVVYELSRLFRNSRKIEDIIIDFNARNITLVSIAERVDITTIHGRAQAKQIAIQDQAEVERLAARTKHGMDAGKAKGAVYGRPPVVSAADIKIMKNLRKAKVPVWKISARFKCSDATVYNNT